MPRPATPCPAPPQPAVFIDKDGTLVHNVPYNAEPARQRLMPGAARALAALADAGFALVVVTNQSGLALGRFTAEQFERLCGDLRRQLRESADVALTDLLFCPHAPGAGGRAQCPCRKPLPGMLHTAAERHGLDLARSWMVGDTLDDVEAGRRAGCRALLLCSGGETEWLDGPHRRPDAFAGGWDGVARHLLARCGAAT